MFRVFFILGLSTIEGWPYNFLSFAKRKLFYVNSQIFLRHYFLLLPRLLALNFANHDGLNETVPFKSEYMPQINAHDLFLLPTLLALNFANHDSLNETVPFKSEYMPQINAHDLFLLPTLFALNFDNHGGLNETVPFKTEYVPQIKAFSAFDVQNLVFFFTDTT
ncbi:jg18059 [Pararge aegeria aegeria]|uniref:Jg18059 protein n=1 Tax=Pararge aegeria aegeria TaxID=348720 RepID=A0A8S4RIY4_9NEOP|nr:jg18059 [Pararge aegeria aegeria]